MSRGLAVLISVLVFWQGAFALLGIARSDMLDLF
jgi:hypothetical protein